jgi:hypothetical protein
MPNFPWGWIGKPLEERAYMYKGWFYNFKILHINTIFTCSVCCSRLIELQGRGVTLVSLAYAII